MFDVALQNERDLGLNFWDKTCPTVDSISFTVPAPDGSGAKAIDWNGKLDKPAQSVDQRVKFPAWMAEFEKRGGRLTIKEAGVADLEDLREALRSRHRRGRQGRDRQAVRTRRREIAVRQAAAGAGADLCARHDAARRTFRRQFQSDPDGRRIFRLSRAHRQRPCEIMVLEGIPGGPMDCWSDVKTPAEHLGKSKWILDTFLPWEAERCRAIELTDDNGILSGAFAPTVRKPIGRLPSGALVLGLADAVCLNDPITGQGSNNASKAAKIYMDAIVAQGDRPFDAAFMQATFDAIGPMRNLSPAGPTRLLQPPPPHVLQLMGAAQSYPVLASRIANAFRQSARSVPLVRRAGGGRALFEEARLRR